jgi:two-component system OmpR family response regulator
VRILVVEDEPVLAQQLARALEAAGYVVDCAGDGARADLLATVEPYDAIVLDLGLPVIDGLTLLGRWRDAGLAAPILILTARGDWHEKVRGIDGGADDYVVKPFRTEEVIARIRALIRRASGHAQALLACGALTLDPRTGAVTRDGDTVRLTSHEFRVLAYLMHHRDRVVSGTELAEHLYPLDSDRDSNTIEVFVARLRRKCGAAAIQTVRGLGYRVTP